MPIGRSCIFFGEMSFKFFTRFLIWFILVVELRTLAFILRGGEPLGGSEHSSVTWAVETSRDSEMAW